MLCIAIRLMTVRFPAITLMVSLKMTSITWHPFLNIGQPPCAGDGLVFAGSKLK